MFISDDPIAETSAGRYGASISGDGRARIVMLPVGMIEDRRQPGGRSLLDPVYIAKAIWNSKLLILATTIAGVLFAIAIAATTPKLFVATAQILMDPRDLKVVANEVTPNGLPSEATLALIESQTSVIMSSNVLSRVIAQARLDEDPEFNGDRKSGLATLLPAAFTSLVSEPDEILRDREYRTLARLRYALTVSRETKSFVINLSVDSSDPDKAARLANLTADIFIEEQGRVQSDTARRATTALSSRLSELRQSVVRAEQAVEDYKSQNALIGVGGRLVDDEYITRINDQLATARGDITALRVKADSMRNASVEDVVRGTLPEELSSEALVRLRQTYSDLAQQAAVLGTKLGPRHPQRIASEGALTASRQAIAGELSRIVAAAQTELARAVATESNLTDQINALKDKQVTTSGSFVKLRELEREVDASRAVYEAYLLRARETSEQESLNTANVRVISAATPPLDPAGMSRKVVVAGGGIAGFILGVGLAVFFAVLRLLRGVFGPERRKAPANRWPEAQRQPAGTAVAAASPYAAGPVYDHPPVATPPSAAPPENIPVPSGMRPSIHESGDALRRAAPAPASTAAVETEPAPSEEAPASPASSPEEDGLEVAARRAEEARRTRLAEIEAGLAETERERASEAPALPHPSSLSVAEDRTVASSAHEAPIAASYARPSSLSLAEAVRGGSRAESDRVSLRDRVRALSAESDRRAGDGTGDRRDELDPEVAQLRDDIQTVKQAIADIRRRRETQALHV